MANPPNDTVQMVNVGSFRRDDNDVPITFNGLTTVDSQTLSASGATAAVPIFSITGSVQVNALYGVVTTALGNCTAAYWRLNDGSAQSDISLSTGTTLTSATAGSIIIRRPLASTALTFVNASQERVQDPPAASANPFTPTILVQKTGGVATNVEFVYTTSDTPTSGSITFYIAWVPLAQGSKITSL